MENEKEEIKKPGNKKGKRNKLFSEKPGPKKKSGSVTRKTDDEILNAQPIHNLDPKHYIFAEEYLKTGPYFNATEAARRAGYAKESNNPDSLRVVANYLLNRDDVKKYIEVRRADAARELNIYFDDIVREYAKIAFFDIKSLYNEDGTFKEIHELDEKASAAILAIEVDEIFGGKFGNRETIGVVKRVKLRDKLLALDKLCELLGYNKAEMKVIRDAQGNIIQTEATKLLDLPIVFK